MTTTNDVGDLYAAATTVELEIADPNTSRPLAQSLRDLGDRIKNGWEPGRWWRVIGPDGELWCETSNESEAQDAMRPGDRLERLWVAEQTEWREAPTEAAKT